MGEPSERGEPAALTFALLVEAAALVNAAAVFHQEAQGAASLKRVWMLYN